MRFFQWRENLRGSLWFIPTLCVALAVALGTGLTYVDRHSEGFSFAFGGGAESARGFLSTIASSMITFTGLVFSITIVVLQLASQQFSPRVLRTFLRDRHSQLALGIFTATFTYALVVLREVRAEDGPGEAFVPGLAVTGSFVLVMLSLAVFVDYIHHIAQSIRVGSITTQVGDETHRAIADIYDHAHVAPPVPLPAGGRTTTIAAPERGVIQGLDRDRLTELAAEHDLVVEIVPAIGDFVPQGTTVMRLHGDPLPRDVHPFLDAVAFGMERTMRQDPAFGFRQLVDIAERSLSPAINDPTTAVQCLDELHDLLRQLATKAFPSGQRLDAEGRVRLTFPVTTWDSYVSLACDEIRNYGKTSIQVHRRMRSMLADLLTVAEGDRRAAVTKQLELLERSADMHLDHEEDRTSARQGDEQGLGGT